MMEVLANKISTFRSGDIRFSNSRQNRSHDNFESGNNRQEKRDSNRSQNNFNFVDASRHQYQVRNPSHYSGHHITKMLIFPVKITIDLIDMIIGSLLQSVQCVIVIVVLAKLLQITVTKKITIITKRLSHLQQVATIASSLSFLLLNVVSICCAFHVSLSC